MLIRDSAPVLRRALPHGVVAAVGVVGELIFLVPILTWTRCSLRPRMLKTVRFGRRAGQWASALSQRMASLAVPRRWSLPPQMPLLPSQMLLVFWLNASLQVFRPRAKAFFTYLTAFLGLGSVAAGLRAAGP